MSLPPFTSGLAGGLDRLGLMSGLLLASAKAAVAVLLVLALRALAGRRLPPRWRAALWLPVAIRLLLPVGPRNPWSLFALAADGGTTAGSGELLPGLGGGVAPAAGGAAAGGGAWAGLVAQIHAHAPLLTVLLAAVWVLGVAVLALRRWTAVRRLDALMAARTAVSQQPALRVLKECRTAFGLRVPVELAESPRVAGPCLCPPRRGRPPCILLPSGAAATLGEDRLRHVLLHELAHLAHRDLAVRRLAGLLRTLHWFNPLVHLAARALRADQELAADERALALLAPSERPRYGRTLIDLLPGTAASSPAAAFVETRNQLHWRILMIARFSPRHRLATAAAAALLLLLAGLVLTDGGAEAAPAATGPPWPPHAAAGVGAAAGAPGHARDRPCDVGVEPGPHRRRRRGARRGRAVGLVALPAHLPRGADRPAGAAVRRRPARGRPVGPRLRAVPRPHRRRRRLPPRRAQRRQRRTLRDRRLRLRPLPAEPAAAGPGVDRRRVRPLAGEVAPPPAAGGAPSPGPGRGRLPAVSQTCSMSPAPGHPIRI